VFWVFRWILALILVKKRKKNDRFCVLGFSLEPLHFSLIYEIFPSNRSPIGGTLKARFGNTLVTPCVLGFSMNFSIIIYKNVSKLHFFWVYLLTNFSEQKNDFKLHDLVSKMSFFCVFLFLNLKSCFWSQNICFGALFWPFFGHFSSNFD
jgi:hypothetical protein